MNCAACVLGINPPFLFAAASIAVRLGAGVRARDPRRPQGIPS